MLIAVLGNEPKTYFVRLTVFEISACKGRLWFWELRASSLYFSCLYKAPTNEVFRGKMTPFQKKSKLCPKVFMNTPIHVLCSNFTEIVRREVGETMHCMFCEENSSQNAVYWRHFGPIWRSAPKVCRGACHVSPCKISCQWIPICQSYSRKSDLVRIQYMTSAYKKPGQHYTTNK